MIKKGDKVEQDSRNSINNDRVWDNDYPGRKKLNYSSQLNLATR